MKKGTFFPLSYENKLFSHIGRALDLLSSLCPLAYFHLRNNAPLWLAELGICSSSANCIFGLNSSSFQVMLLCTIVNWLRLNCMLTIDFNSSQIYRLKFVMPCFHHYLVDYQIKESRLWVHVIIAQETLVGFFFWILDCLKIFLLHLNSFINDRTVTIWA